jgi:spore coat polysaccharide biosynthesis protein SpsF
MIGIIIQARLGSTRLPQKMLKPFFNGKGIFELITSRIIDNFPTIPIVVATTTNPLDNEIEKLCQKLNVNCFRGSENNVLQRFIETAEKYQISKIVRVCADNPFLNLIALKELIEYGSNSSADYISFRTSFNKPTILTHYGLWAEMVSTNALIKASKITDDKLHLEHVTNFIYLNENLFELDLIEIPSSIEQYSNVRMTLDTIDDFMLLQEIYEKIPNLDTSTEMLIQTVASNKIWTEKMNNQIIQNTK